MKRRFAGALHAGWVAVWQAASLWVFLLLTLTVSQPAGQAGSAVVPSTAIRNLLVGEADIPIKGVLFVLECNRASLHEVWHRRAKTVWGPASAEVRIDVTVKPSPAEAAEHASLILQFTAGPPPPVSGAPYKAFSDRAWYGYTRTSGRLIFVRKNVVADVFIFAKEGIRPEAVTRLAAVLGRKVDAAAAGHPEPAPVLPPTRGFRPPGASAAIYNDNKLLRDASKKLVWEGYAPSVAAADGQHRVHAPPRGEMAACMRWLKKFVRPDFLPPGVADHLMAMKGWPKAGGEDVFVVWYGWRSRLIHMVETNGSVVLFTAPTGRAQAPVSASEHQAYALRVAKAVLRKELWPHDLAPPVPVRSEKPGLTSGSWLPATLTIRKEPGSEAKFPGRGLLAVATPTAETAGAIRFVTDGRFVQFTIRKEFRGNRRPAPMAPRFGISAKASAAAVPKRAGAR